VPDLVLYLKIDVRRLIPRVLESKGMDYWESGMHLKLGGDIFDSFRRYQTRLIREYDAIADELGFATVDACRPIDVIQQDLRGHIGRYLAGERPVRPRRPGSAVRRLARGRAAARAARAKAR
jgi:dTMP kinase